MTDQTDRLSGVIGDVAMKSPVRVASTANLSLLGLQTIDGIGINAGDRVLAKDQTNAVENGIWVCDTGDWERAKDWDGQYDVVEGTLVRVNRGSANSGTFWAVSTTGTIIPGATAITLAASASAIQGVTAVGLAVLTAISQAAARVAIDSPSNAQAVLDSIIQNQGDIIAGESNGTVVLVPAGNDADMLVRDTTTPSSGPGLIWQPQYQRSLAPNPFFQIDQDVNLATSHADDTYCLDRWYVLTQTAAIAVSQQTDQADGKPSNIRLIQSQASAQRMGIACVIEGKDCRGLRSQGATFMPAIRCSSAQAVRVAVLEWSGTEDVVTSDVVNDWTSGDYTTGAARFFKNTTQTVVGTVTVTPSANVWTNLPAFPFSMGSTANNLILMVWTEGTAAQNVTLDVTDVRLVRGAVASRIEIPNYVDEWLRSVRHYWVMRRDPGLLNSDFVAAGMIATTAIAFIHARPPVKMRGIPSLIVSAVGDFLIVAGATSSAVTLLGAISSPPSSADAISFNATGTGTPYTVGDACRFLITGNNTFIALSARL